MVDTLATLSPEARAELLANRPAPAVGVPATMGVGSDSYAMEITAVSASGTTVKARYLNEDGTLSGSEHVFTRRKNGRLVLKGETLGWRNTSLAVGFARDYRDPSF